ncbi:MAG: L,D-transpeptidase family protein [Candidatus Omnitrophota bacterium]|nr:L,D-transpeptidase family protein [Candidatus Omnitrophota bacterium]
MNKNILVIALIVLLSVTALFLAYNIVKRVSSPEPKQEETGQRPEPKPLSSAPGESEPEYLASAENYVKRGDLLKGKEAYQGLIEKYPGSNNAAKVQEAIDNLNIAVLFSAIPTPDSVIYEVQKGDTLTKISKKFATTAELISRANSLKDGKVMIGKKLKISKARFSLIVDKSQNILTLKSDQEIFKTYRVSTGKSSCTPVGTFKVTNKLIDPPWYPSAGGMIPAKDPKNVLGSRWIGISKQGYGIHGTLEPESIGKSVTEGCVRLKNTDVEELYSIIPIGTEVVIID